MATVSGVNPMWFRKGPGPLNRRCCECQFLDVKWRCSHFDNQWVHQLSISCADFEAAVVQDPKREVRKNKNLWGDC